MYKPDSHINFKQPQLHVGRTGCIYYSIPSGRHKLLHKQTYKYFSLLFQHLFRLSSSRCLSLNPALWETPLPVMWPLCHHSYRTHRTVWSTVPSTREEAWEVSQRAPALSAWTRRDLIAIQLKNKISKGPVWIMCSGVHWRISFLAELVQSHSGETLMWWWTF